MDLVQTTPSTGLWLKTDRAQFGVFGQSQSAANTATILASASVLVVALATAFSIVYGAVSFWRIRRFRQGLARDKTLLSSDSPPGTEFGLPGL